MTLPIISVQHDFQTVISDVNDGVVSEEDFWASCYKKGENSVHGKVRVALGDRGGSGGRDLQLVSRDGVLFEQEERGRYFASCPALSIPKTRVQVPRHTIRDAENTRQITTLSVSPDLSQVVVGHADGNIRRLPYRTADAIQPLTYTPHLSGTSVTTVRFFPSSRVLLSGGADFTLHILDADPALTQTATLSPARTLKGHIRAVTDTAIIAKGRNVLSSAKDGTLRLWDVGSGTQIRVMGSQKYAGINALSLGEAPFPTTTDIPKPDSREVETAGKLVFAGLQDGNFECFDLTAKASSYHSASSPSYQLNGAITSVSLSAETNLAATGSAKGVVTVFDLRKLQEPLCTFQRNEASIEGLSFTPSGSLVIVTEDGLPYVAGVQRNGAEVLAELAAGADCEASRSVHVDSSGGIWVAGDDGIVRLY